MCTTSVTINGTTYNDYTGEHDIIDGEVYVTDPNHSGYFFLNEEGVNKYFGGDSNLVQDMSEDEFYTPYNEDGEGDYDPKFPYFFAFYHATGYINPETGEAEEITPHGEVYEEAFVAWFNDFPVEVFEDDENVVHHSFCDG